MAMTKAERAAAAKRAAAKKTRQRSARAEATRITQKEKQPYVTAADAAAADAARTMTPEQIAAQYGANYAAATGTAGMLAPTTAANAANATSMLSGLVGALPGAGSYDVTSLLADYTGANAANARLGAMYAGSLAADICAAGAAGIAGAQGRASERMDRLSSEERELRLKGDVAGSNYLTNLNNILNIRGQRQNLALSKFQLEQAKREEERRGRGGSGGSTSTPTSTPAATTPATTRGQGIGVPGTSGYIPSIGEVIGSGGADAIPWYAQYGVDTTTPAAPTTPKPPRRVSPSGRYFN